MNSDQSPTTASDRPTLVSEQNEEENAGAMLLQLLKGESEGRATPTTSEEDWQRQARFIEIEYIHLQVTLLLLNDYFYAHSIYIILHHIIPYHIISYHIKHNTT